MKDLAGKVAVVTGGASGIGKAIATRFAAEGMKIVLADVEERALEATQAELAASGASVLAVRTDVSDGAQVEALAARTRERFGAAHVICNNAGVGGGGGPMWTLTEADWRWTIDVNLWGVIHGIRAFVPGLVAQGEGHVVNTASMAGLISPAMMGPYVATKHAVVALSETLALDLLATASPVKVSVLCPGFVRTGIAESDRNRPAHLKNPAGDAPNPGAVAAAQMIRAAVEGGISAEVVADHVVSAVREERFYVLPHPEMKGAIKHRMDDILGERYPRLPKP
jgi:NAD(P)-dependent dehydrogenase (short-subunit alcohol dehydrogenase family)